MPAASHRATPFLRIALLCCTTLLTTGLAAQPGTLPSPSARPQATLQLNRAALAALPPANLNAVADSIEARLKDHAAGYAFVISYRDQVMVTRAGGMARRAPDGSPRAMTVDERFNVASVSKTITAAALMKLLSSRRGALLDSSMVRFLPSGWTFGNRVQQITLRQLLTHNSGIRCPMDTTIPELRQCLAAGVQDTAWGVWQYNNLNFGLMRPIIARLAAPNAIMLNTPEGQANFYNNQYIAYTRANVLEPAGITNAHCHPGVRAGLAYQFPAPVQAGTDFGDMDNRCGSQGWNLSARELGKFVGALLYTDRILPSSVVDRMRNQGLGLYTTRFSPTTWDTGHGGFYPGKNDKGELWNPGEISTAILGLSNGISVAAIVNSQITGASPNSFVSLDAVLKGALRRTLQ